MAINRSPFMWGAVGSLPRPQQPEIEGMIDCDRKQVHEGDIVEYFNKYYCVNKLDPAQPLYGVVRWNTTYFTYEPLIFVEECYEGNSFAYVCQHRKEDEVGFSWSYFKVIGNIEKTPQLLEKLEMTQENWYGR